MHEFGASYAHWRLVAEQLHLVARVVAVEPDALAGWGVAVAAGVDQAHVGDRILTAQSTIRYSTETATLSVMCLHCR